MSDSIITGIDVGTTKVAVISASMSEEDKLPRVLGFSSVSSHGVKKGQIVDINLVTGAIEEAVEKAERMAGTKIKSAYVSVSGPHIESLNSHGVVAVSQPEVEISSADVDRAVDAAKAISLSSTKEIIEVIPREFIVDGQEGIKNPTGMSGVRLEVNTHIITAGITNLKNLDRCLSDLDIQTRAYIFSGLASSLASISETEKELGVALVDIGGGKIDVCIFVEGALSYSSSIPVGARHVTNDIAVGLRVSLESAEKIKLFLSDEKLRDRMKDQGKDDVDISPLKLPEELKKISYKTVTDGIIRPRMDEMFENIMQEIENSEFITQIPSGLVITGGGALTAGILQSARRVIGTPARISVPQSVTGLVDEVLYPQYAAVVGLLLYAKEAESEEKKVDLKDFDKIFRNISVKSSVKKLTDLVKSFVP